MSEPHNFDDQLMMAGDSIQIYSLRSWITTLYLSRRGGGLQAVREKYRHRKVKVATVSPSL